MNCEALTNYTLRLRIQMSMMKYIKQTITEAKLKEIQSLLQDNKDAKQLLLLEESEELQDLLERIL